MLKMLEWLLARIGRVYLSILCLDAFIIGLVSWIVMKEDFGNPQYYNLPIYFFFLFLLFFGELIRTVWIFSDSKIRLLPIGLWKQYNLSTLITAAIFILFQISSGGGRGMFSRSSENLLVNFLETIFSSMILLLVFEGLLCLLILLNFFFKQFVKSDFYCLYYLLVLFFVFIGVFYIVFYSWGYDFNASIELSAIKVKPLFYLYEGMTLLFFYCVNALATVKLIEAKTSWLK